MKKSEVPDQWDYRKGLWKRFAVLGLACWVAAVALFSVPGISSLEWKLLDVWAVQAYGERDIGRNLSAQVAVIEVDEGLFENQHLEWPLDKNIYGDLLDYLDTMGAQAAVFDLLFTDNLSDCGKGDELFRAMLGYFPNTVITFGGLVDPSLSQARPSLIPARYHFGAPVGNLDPMFGAILPYPELLEVSPRLAANNLKAMEDGIDRNVPLFQRDGENLVPGMGLMGALLLNLDSAGQYPNWNWIAERNCIQTNSKCLAVDSKGNIYPRFRDSIPEYNLSDLRSAQAAFFRGEVPAIGRLQLQGRVVFIGASAPSLGDLGSTPISGFSRMGKTPNVLMHARAADALLQGKVMRPWARSELLWFSLILVCVGILIYSWVSVRRGLLANLVLILFVPVASFYGYGQGFYWPILEILLAQVLLLGCGLWMAFRERDMDHRYLEQTFSTYLSQDVIKDMARNREHPQLGGMDVLGSALFSDIEGFSSFSEILSPQQLVSLLNEYFEKMTDVLLDHGATVDKFIGDAIVAFWGAPRANADHARQAVLAAVAMQKALDALRRDWETRPGVPEGIRKMRMRIGVNSGRFVVGNMGCATRMHYTMMGDTVNLAARLESISGKYGAEILIGSETRKVLSPEDVSLRLLDRIRVKGRANPEAVFEVLGPSNISQNPLCDQYGASLEAYIQGDFEGAMKGFQIACSLEPLAGRANPSQVLGDRCAELLRHPPGNWDGVWTWDAK
jgi:adenylate cyclase